MVLKRKWNSPRNYLWRVLWSPGEIQVYSWVTDFTCLGEQFVCEESLFAIEEEGRKYLCIPDPSIWTIFFISAHLGCGSLLPVCLHLAGLHTCPQSHLQTSPPTPQESYPKIRNPRTTFHNTPLSAQNLHSAGGVSEIVLVGILIVLLLRSPCNMSPP